jgi:superfamily II DNA or RNA helicase
MIPRLRPYQQKLKQDIYDVWVQNPRANVLAVAATGSGKTVIFSEVIREHQGASVAVAHRQELVGQISLALARNGVRHRIIGSDSVYRTCVQLHLLELNVSYVEPSAMCAVAGVDTLIRMDERDPWFQQVTLGVMDETHHLLKSNKWGKAVTKFPNARWLGVTATPMRADGAGLGRQAKGIMDHMVLAPTMRDLIRMGYLTDYRIFCPPSDIDLSNVPVAAGGDFSPEPLRQAVHKSHIVGDVVSHYMRLAQGKLGVTFAVDVQSANDIARSFNDAGVRAEVVSAKTPDAMRIAVLRKFKAREIMQLVNVDLFGEGFDLPAIEVVSMARPTQSFPLFAQQFGRALRLMVDDAYAAHWDTYTDDERRAIIAASSKPKAMIIDHVSNVKRHGLPDAPQKYNLFGRPARSKAATPMPVRMCAGCGATYERREIACPYCGEAPEVAGRTAPHQVDGDLFELSPEALAKLRREAESDITRGPAIPYGAEQYIVSGIMNRHREKLDSRESLRDIMALWAGQRTQAQEGPELRRVMKEFFLRFGTDVLTAQTLTRAETEALTERIREDI